MHQFTFNNQRVGWRHISLNKLLCKCTIKRDSLFFADIISLRRGHILLGPVRAFGEALSEYSFQTELKLFRFLFTYGGIRALTISNLARSAYGLIESFL